MFHSSIPRLFRTTLIGHLYEICQSYPTVLVSEHMDEETNIALSNKSLFPKLVTIEAVSSDSTGKPSKNLVDRFLQHSYFRKLSDNLMKKHTPDIVIVENDVYPFEMHLLRAAKREKAVTIAIQSCVKIPVESNKILHTHTLASAKFPNLLPLSIRLTLVRLQRLLGHFLVYWIFPLSNLTKPFKGPTSYITWNSVTGLRQADRYVVLSKAYYNQFLKEGVDKTKLLVLPHPLSREPRSFFKQAYPNTYAQNKSHPTNKDILTILLPGFNSGFDRATLEPIDATELFTLRINKVLSLVSSILPTWTIYLKAHPLYDIASMPSSLSNLVSDNVFLADQYDPIDRYIEMSRSIIATPPITSVLLTARYQKPDIVLLAVDLANEFGGDFYKEFPGVEYIHDIQTLTNALEALQKKSPTKSEFLTTPENHSLTLPTLIDQIVSSINNTKGKAYCL